MGVTNADFQLLRRTPVKNPKAEELAGHFEDFLEWCQVNGKPVLKGYWISFLNITKQTYYNWNNASKNVEFTEEEINDRITLIKKIDSILENGMTVELLQAKYPTGVIFYMKNAFDWKNSTDNDNKTISVQIGTVLPKKRREDNKK